MRKCSEVSSKFNQIGDTVPCKVLCGVLPYFVVFLVDLESSGCEQKVFILRFPKDLFKL